MQPKRRRGRPRAWGLARVAISPSIAWATRTLGGFSRSNQARQKAWSDPLFSAPDSENRPRNLRTPPETPQSLDTWRLTHVDFPAPVAQPAPPDIAPQMAGEGGAGFGCLRFVSLDCQLRIDILLSNQTLHSCTLCEKYVYCGKSGGFHVRHPEFSRRRSGAQDG